MKLVPILLALVVGFAQAQEVSIEVRGALPATSPASGSAMLGRLYTNLATMPVKRSSFDEERVKIGCVGTASGTSGPGLCNTGSQTPNRYAAPNISGSFRTTCGFSHSAYDDPIIYPGQPGKSGHPHLFYGNDSTSGLSNAYNMASSGGSTCSGGEINRTGYWIMAPIYSCPVGAIGCIPHGSPGSRDGEVYVSYTSNFYYKCAKGYSCAGMQWFPDGLVMLAGNPTATSAGQFDGNWECYNPGPMGTQWDHIPTQAEVTAAHGASTCPTLSMTVRFPECWDGVNLDSPDHKSHMGFANYTLGCNDPAYPVKFAQVELVVKFSVTWADLPYFRLTSDPACAHAGGPAGTGTCAGITNNGQPAGWTTHSDWAGGWKVGTVALPGGINMTIGDLLKQECYLYAPSTHSDCHDNLLGNPSGNGTDWLTLH